MTQSNAIRCSAATILLTVLLPCEGVANGSDSGLECLYVATVALGHDIDFEILRSMMGRPTVVGYGLKQLDDAATELGFSTLIVRTDAADLAKHRKARRFACVAEIDPGKFVLIADSSGTQWTIIDPPSVFMIDQAVWGQRWGGHALLISKTAFGRSDRESPRYAVIATAYIASGLFTAMAIWFAYIHLIRPKLRSN